MPTFNYVAAKADVTQLCGSISKAAEKLGMDRTLLSRILSGDRPGSLDLAVRIGDLTGQIPYRYFGPDDPRAAAIEMCKRMGITAADFEDAA